MEKCCLNEMESEQVKRGRFSYIINFRDLLCGDKKIKKDSRFCITQQFNYQTQALSVISCHIKYNI